MSAFSSLALAYLLGGLTFLPLLLLLLFCHAYLTQPIARPSDPHLPDPLALSEREKASAFDQLKGLPSDVSTRSHEPDVAAGYFAVCRDFSQGLSALKEKPRDRPDLTSASNSESPSVYASMYRSIFDRGRHQTPTLDPAARNSRSSRNTFFIVIRCATPQILASYQYLLYGARLGLLMLYDDADQLEVRYAISLAHYETDIYGGGEDIPEGELFVKRNCIRMSPRPSSETPPSDSLPFYLFSNNCSEKEDFYHAMLQNQGRDGGSVPTPLAFNREDIVKLIRQLHASEDNLQTRWLNALIGRVFLSMYKTSVVEQLVRKKISKKLSRVAKPAMITAIQLRGMHLGDAAPLITGPKLRELTRDGDLTLEADVKYKGGIHVDIAIIARIDLGQRFKVREVELLLAVVCKSLEGHMVFRMKPPPSNRIWFAFETMPKMDLLLEPVVSSRQITYALILRTIESKLREVIKDTLVLPNWDDVQFADTLNHPVRGGLWEHDSSDALNAQLSTAPTLAQGGEAIQMQDDDIASENVEKSTPESVGPLRDGVVPSILQPKNRLSNSVRTDATGETAVSSSLGPSSQSAPKAIRPNSFASAARPVISHEQVVIDALKDINRPAQHDAASTMKDISSRSQTCTPTGPPVGSLMSTTEMQRKNDNGQIASAWSGNELQLGIPEQTPSAGDEASLSINGAAGIKDEGGLSSLAESSLEAPKLSVSNKRQTFASTAAAAKKWGLEFVARNSLNASVSIINNLSDKNIHDQPDSSASSTPLSNFRASTDGSGTKSSPMGRGQPLPPLGQPLPTPRPNRMTWTSMLGRKSPKIDHSRLSPASPMSSSVNTPWNQKATDHKLFTPPSLSSRNARVNPSTIEDLSKGSLIPRPVKPASLRRTGSDENGGFQDDEEFAFSDGVLVIKAPESKHSGEGDEPPLTRSGTCCEADTLSDDIHLLSQDISRDLPSSADSRWADEDLQLHDLPYSYASSTSSSVLSEPLKSSLYRLPAHPLTTSRSAPLLSRPLLPDSPPFNKLVAILPQHDHPHTKSHSRQSFIPTPVGSRRRFPLEIANMKGIRRRTAPSMVDGVADDV